LQLNRGGKKKEKDWSKKNLDAQSSEKAMGDMGWEGAPYKAFLHLRKKKEGGNSEFRGHLADADSMTT